MTWHRALVDFAVGFGLCGIIHRLAYRAGYKEGSRKAYLHANKLMGKIEEAQR